jgi:energy-coupling factor transporter ATP-binding protein EcfA2
MRFTSLKLTNFTVFKEAEFEFAPGVNVFVGANGTGKTHALKILYGLQLFGRDRQLYPSLATMFYRDMFHKELISTSSGPNEPAQIIAYAENNGKWDVQVVDGGEIWALGQAPTEESVPRPVFIPAIDMLAHTQRFLSTYDEFKIDFDRTYRDIVALLLSPERRKLDELGIDLKDLTGGAASDIEEENERFYIKSETGRFAAPMVAEGVRKLATVVQLIKNGWIRPGTTLFWDEPEVSVNPSLMTELVKMILKLADAGVQVFIATHNYELLKELDLQAKQGDVRYFALELVNNEAVVHPTDSYDEIQPNKIAEEFDSLYDRQLTRATGRSRKNGGRG